MSMKNINMNGADPSKGPIDPLAMSQAKGFLAEVDKLSMDQLGVAYKTLVREGRLEDLGNLVQAIKSGSTPEGFIGDLRTRYGLVATGEIGNAQDTMHFNMRKAAIVEFVNSNENWVLGKDGNGYSHQQGMLAKLSVEKHRRSWMWAIEVTPSPSSDIKLEEVEEAFPHGNERRKGHGFDIVDCLDGLDILANKYESKFGNRMSM